MLRTVLLLAFMTLTSAPAQAQSAFSAAAFVNDSIITEYDVDQRSKMLLIAGAPQNSELRALALRSMIDGKLKRGAGKAAGITAPGETSAQSMEVFARSLRLTTAQLEAKLKSAGVSPGAIRDFLETDIIWGNVIRQRFGSRVNLTDEEVEAEISASGLTQKTTYNIGEMSLPDGGNPSATMASARKIADEVRAGASFSDLARKHSRSPSRSKGGVIGWVPADRIPPEVANTLATLEVGGVSDPVKVRGGVTILTLFDKRVEEVTINGENRAAIRRRMEIQRLEGFAQTYLEELRAAAFIEEK